MPKSQKQKKAKIEDFSKSKLKVGKTKKLPNNATNTSYSVKSIGLPNQNLKKDDQTDPTTKWNLTLDDLIVRLRHYSPTTRKDALIGLRELLHAHHDLWRPNLGRIIHNSARLVSDENPVVRKGLRDFFQWFLPLVDLKLLEPFCSIVIFFVCSALAHIFTHVRVDAIHIIDILLEVAPTSVVSGFPIDSFSIINDQANLSVNSRHHHGIRLLQCYLSILSIGSDSATAGLSSTSTNQLSATSRLIVIKSLARFVSVATAFEKPQKSCQISMPLWIFRGAFACKRDFEMFSFLLTQPDSHQKDLSFHQIIPSAIYNDDNSNSHKFELFNEAFLDDESLQRDMNDTDLDTSLSGPSSSATQEITPDTPLKLLRLIHPLVLSIFLDNAPEAFRAALVLQSSSSSSSSSSSLQLVYYALSTLHCLWRGSILTNLKFDAADFKSLLTILEKMSPYFVFGSDEIEPQNPESKRILQSLNLVYCDLVSLLALSKQASDHSLSIQLDRVGNHIAQLLNEDANVINPTAQTLDPIAYIDTIPIIWSLLRRGFVQNTSLTLEPSNLPNQVLESFINHLDRLSCRSELKALGIQFLARLCIIDDLPGCNPACLFDSFSLETQDKLRKWVLGLPKVLWALGHKDPNTSFSILSFLHRAVSLPMTFFETCFPLLPSLLVPFFLTTNPNSGRPIYGPYHRLPVSCQQIADGLGWYLINNSNITQASGLKLALAGSKAYKLQTS
ncbi:hypothetical protein O181_028228 [Austropuccinia psidii MF-1]|uniref:Pre-rRNA-processing protein n=1 Tax=Austropuccinia psidii MF-1 TaxID=1389203 RepID=A0A9Q3H1L7_9BASI|nr:hypothetical protein [Austropuccinia psidii MF-1]